MLYETANFKYLEKYIHKKFELEMNEVAEKFYTHLNNKQKPPTAKQFAKISLNVTNNWLSGNLSETYSYLKEKSPVKPNRRDYMPEYKSVFEEEIYKDLSKRLDRGEHNNFYINKIIPHTYTSQKLRVLRGKS